MKTAIAIRPMMTNVLSVATIPPATVTTSQMARIAPRSCPDDPAHVPSMRPAFLAADSRACWGGPCRAAPGRSRPALDGHDDAAAEAQLGADELSVLQQAVTHHDQGRPKLLIGVAGKVHVVHDDDATLAKRGHSPAQLEDLPAGRVREDQVKLAEPADDLGPVP